MLNIGQTVYTICAKQTGGYVKPEFIPGYKKQYPITHHRYRLYINSQEIVKFLGTKEGIIYITDGHGHLSFKESPDGILATVPTPVIIPEHSEENEEEKHTFKSKPVYLTAKDAAEHLQEYKKYVESTYSHAEVTEIADHIIRGR